jgi:hypothetical protein
MGRKLYRDAEILVMNDAGVGLSTPADPAHRDFLMSKWGAEGLLPPACTECTTSPHVMPFISWNMGLDPDVTLSMFSSYGDDTIAGFFLGISDEEFKTALLDETDKLYTSYPERYRRFFIEGDLHTALGRDNWGTVTRDGKTLREWTIAMVEGDETVWTDMP